jgi:hypothetical protein
LPTRRPKAAIYDAPVYHDVWQARWSVPITILIEVVSANFFDGRKWFASTCTAEIAHEPALIAQVLWGCYKTRTCGGDVVDDAVAIIIDAVAVFNFGMQLPVLHNAQRDGWGDARPHPLLSAWADPIPALLPDVPILIDQTITIVVVAIAKFGLCNGWIAPVHRRDTKRQNHRQPLQQSNHVAPQAPAVSAGR